MRYRLDLWYDPEPVSPRKVHLWSSDDLEKLKRMAAEVLGDRENTVKAEITDGLTPIWFLAKDEKSRGVSP